VAAGATLLRPPGDQPHGRTATIRDPYGHRWLVQGPARHAAASSGGHPRPGDIVYVSLWLPDPARARAFFSSVLDWKFDETGRQVEGLSLHHGLWAFERSTLFLCIGVDDLGRGVERVRRAGGTAEEPHREPHGELSGCVDDQGMQFALYAREAAEGSGPGAEGAVAGDLTYVTIETIDSARFRAFFSEVAGWRFAPGRVEDGWGVEDVVPMTGMRGGQAQPTVVPMYRVDDLAAAVDRVRAGGGTAGDPEEQPYGMTAECTDDQGTRFYLGML
jgi:predicted enzyme related to lactoylglutathione lyase